MNVWGPIVLSDICKSHIKRSTEEVVQGYLIFVLVCPYIFSSNKKSVQGERKFREYDLEDRFDTQVVERDVYRCH